MADQPDLAGLRRALERSERFRRDTLLGGVFHLGKLSFREVAPTDSVHITIDGNRLSAHVDDISPLRRGPDGRARYSWPRVVAHNLFGIAGGIVRRLQGRHGQQRCNLDCEVVWVEEEVACPTSSGEEMPTTPAVGMALPPPRKPCWR